MHRPRLSIAALAALAATIAPPVPASVAAPAAPQRQSERNFLPPERRVETVRIRRSDVLYDTSCAVLSDLRRPLFPTNKRRLWKRRRRVSR